MARNKKDAQAAAELKQAIWNIFPGDTVRLRLDVAKRRGAVLGETAIVKSVKASGGVILDADLDEFNHWHVEDLVVSKKGLGNREAL